MKNKLEATVYTQEGKESGKIVLPPFVFDVKWNSDLVHQVLVSMQSNMRSNTADTKGRGEVRGGGKRPWQQKGTGRARHSSRRSPIWRGGGITHGPSNERNYDKKINKKMKQKALAVLLSEKLRKGQILFVDALEFKAPKTSEAAKALMSLSKVDGFSTLTTKKHNNIFVTVPKREASLDKSFRNIPYAEIEEMRNINPVQLATYRYIVMVDPKGSLAFMEGKLAKKGEKTEGKTYAKKNKSKAK